MGKKRAVDTQGFHRMNFLAQAAVLMAPMKYNAHFGSQLTKVQQKSVLRLDPSIKRMFCKRCHSVLIMKKTCDLKVTEKEMIYSCRTCLLEKRFLKVSKPLFNDLHGKDM